MDATEAGSARAGDVDGLVLRAMGPEDAEAALHLSEEAGWNQTAVDWRFMLGRGHAIGVWEPDRGWVASSLTLPLGPDLFWISMVLVTRRQRRRGLGTLLLERCIDRVREAGAVPGLDATELGRPVYRPLGFEDAFAISRWRLDRPATPVPLSAGVTIRAMRPDDLDAVIAFDAQRACMQRSEILRYLFGLVPYHACLAETDGRCVGYAMGRPGRRAAQIGPVVAADPAIALALMSRMTALGASVILDVPDAHDTLSGWLRDNGAIRERGFTRMTLGTCPGLADARCLYALAGPELS